MTESNSLDLFHFDEFRRSSYDPTARGYPHKKHQSGYDSPTTVSFNILLRSLNCTDHSYTIAAATTTSAL